MEKDFVLILFKLKVMHIVAFNYFFGNYSKKFTPNTISNALEENGTKLYGRKIERILAMLTLACKDIFGFEKLTNFSFYWIKVDKKKFKTWFENWFNVKL